MNMIINLFPIYYKDKFNGITEISLLTVSTLCITYSELISIAKIIIFIRYCCDYYLLILRILIKIKDKILMLLKNCDMRLG